MWSGQHHAIIHPRPHSVMRIDALHYTTYCYVKAQLDPRRIIHIEVSCKCYIYASYTTACPTQHSLYRRHRPIYTAVLVVNSLIRSDNMNQNPRYTIWISYAFPPRARLHGNPVAGMDARIGWNAWLAVCDAWLCVMHDCVMHDCVMHNCVWCITEWCMPVCNAWLCVMHGWVWCMTVCNAWLCVMHDCVMRGCVWCMNVCDAWLPGAWLCVMHDSMWTIASVIHNYICCMTIKGTWLYLSGFFLRHSNL